MKYDVVLIEKPFFEGISFLEIKSLFNLLLTDEVYPIEIQSNCESSAMGFITSEAADKINYAYETNTYFANFITDILDDMKNESEDHTYEFKGLKIWLGR
jgi:hypothetical protein